MLLKFPSNIRVRNLLPSIDGGTFAHSLTWGHVNGVSTYNIYRDLVPYGTPTILASTPIDGMTDATCPFVYDSSPWYRISTVNSANEEGILSEPQTDNDNLAYNTTNITGKIPTGNKTSFLSGVQPMASDFMRRQQFAMIKRKLLWQLEDLGESVWLFKRKQANPNDIDDTREYGRNADYYEPIKILVRMVSIAETRLMAEYSYRREKIPRSWTIWCIPLHNKDIIIDRRNRRYEVQNVTEHYWKGLQISHIDLDMFLLPETDSVYKNPQLNIEGKTL